MIARTIQKRATSVARRMSAATPRVSPRGAALALACVSTPVPVPRGRAEARQRAYRFLTGASKPAARPRLEESTEQIWEGTP